MSREESRIELLDELRALHARVDRLAGSLTERHRERLSCRRGCADCCVDDQTVLAVEAERIRVEHPELLSGGRPRAVGACAFLDEEGACRVYESRPYRCRTQGLPLSWIAEDEDGRPMEMRDICVLNEEGRPIDQLPPEDCWTVGPFESELVLLERRFAGAASPRVALRSLFARSPGGDEAR